METEETEATAKISACVHRSARRVFPLVSKEKREELVGPSPLGGADRHTNTYTQKKDKIFFL